MRTLSSSTGGVFSVAYNPLGDQLASGGVYFVAYNRLDELLIPGSGNKTIQLWNPTTGEHLRTLCNGEHCVKAVAYSPDGNQLASGYSDGTIQLWNLTRGQTPCMLSAHSGSISSIAYSRDGNQLATGSSDTTVRLWNALRLPQQACKAFEALTIGQLYGLIMWCSAAYHGRCIQLPEGSMRESTFHSLPQEIREILQPHVAMAPMQSTPTSSPVITTAETQCLVQ